jgi:hypothetical protein
MIEPSREVIRIIDSFVGLAALCDPTTRAILARHITALVLDQLGPDVDRVAAAEILRRLIAAGIDRFNVGMSHAAHPQWGTA